VAAEVEDWQVDEVRDELMRATDAGETRTRADLQASCGIGASDMDAVLNTLRERSVASEVAPGEWELVADDVREARVAARAPAPATEEPEPEPAAGAIEPPRLPREFEPPESPLPVTSAVRITTAMLDALDDASLGALVRAGVVGAGGQRFTFEVLP
jgi:hypothetical protein